jgi:hypothetical protein
MSADTPRITFVAGLGLALVAALGVGCKKDPAPAAGYDATAAVEPLGTTTGAVVTDAGTDATAAADTAGTGGAGGATGAAGAGGTGGGTATGGAGTTADPGATPSAGGAVQVGGSAPVGGSATVGGTATGTATGTTTGGVKAPAVDETTEKKPPAKGMGASGGPAGREDLRPDKSP